MYATFLPPWGNCESECVSRIPNVLETNSTDGFPKSQTAPWFFDLGLGTSYCYCREVRDESVGYSIMIPPLIRVANDEARDRRHNLILSYKGEPGLTIEIESRVMPFDFPGREMPFPRISCTDLAEGAEDWVVWNRVRCAEQGSPGAECSDKNLGICLHVG